MEIKKLKFISKVKDLKEYKERVQETKYVEEEIVAITKTITLPSEEFEKFTNDLRMVRERKSFYSCKSN